MGFQLHTTQHKCVMSPFLCSGTSCHQKPKRNPHCILYPWYHFQWWAVKKNYFLYVLQKNTWPVKTNGLCHWDMFSLITSQVQRGKSGWFLAEWEQRTAVPFPHPHHVILIFLWVMHHLFLTLIPPSTELCLRTAFVISFQQASRGALTNQLPASCWLAPKGHRPMVLGQNTVFQSANIALRLTCSVLTHSQSKYLFFLKQCYYKKQLCFDHKVCSCVQNKCEHFKSGRNSFFEHGH